MCGVFGIAHLKTNNAAELGYLGLFALQHRGQESAGISVFNAETQTTKTYKKEGLVSEVFESETLKSMPGQSVIGHVRYSTAGGKLEENLQPIVGRLPSHSSHKNKLQTVSIVHNGNLTNDEQLRTELQNSGCVLQGTADTELILHLIAKSTAPSFTDKVKYSLQKLEGAFSVLILTESHLYAAVDKFGYRPLSVGNFNGSAVLASETCAFDLIGAHFERDIAPGELLQICLKTGERQTYSLVTAPQKTFACSFEHIYFARPDSLLWKQTSQEVRSKIGKKLAQSCVRNLEEKKYDAVMAIPDSGVPMAMGFALESSLPYVTGLIRNHYVGRTFIEPTQDARNFRVKLKLNPVKSAVAGKSLVVIDDSIVRGTTSKKIIALLREAGAKEIHLKIGSPPVTHPCFYGIDTPKRKDLIAQKFIQNDVFNSSEMAKELGADSLQFLTLEALNEVLDIPSCVSCFTGKYQDKFAICKDLLTDPTNT